jgi:hypothetical protein
MCDDLKEGVIELMITDFTANYFKNIWTFVSLLQLTSGKHKDGAGHIQTHIPHYSGNI